MFFFRAKKQASGPKELVLAAQINEQRITLEPGETLLKAALRQGINFPHSCRIGACGACKCRLLEGKVKALTDISYILSDAEISSGYILACQSLPQSDVRIAVEIAARAPVSGRVNGQVRLTHDIVELQVQLDQPITYKAGQFADIEIASLPGVERSYSFAAPCRADGKVSFFVRKVPGGVFSSLVNDTDIVGSAINIEGPKGHFWLREGDGPLLFVAGGSGLAPILAILEEAADAGIHRPVTLLFGAREQKDLYALDAIAKIAKRWGNSFRFIPVLSGEAPDSSWKGDRGVVTGLIPRVLEPGADVYLCGPPAMIDNAVSILSQEGVPPNRIYADRFTTVHGGGLAA